MNPWSQETREELLESRLREIERERLKDETARKNCPAANEAWSKYQMLLRLARK